MDVDFIKSFKHPLCSWVSLHHWISGFLSKDCTTFYLICADLKCVTLSYFLRSEAGVDVTESLFGYTIYIESAKFPGWWIGSQDNHNGHLFEESERSVFDPNRHCRIHVIDCGSGWACLRTRYQETDAQEVMSSRDPTSRLQKDPASWYLKADMFGVDFSHNTASPEDKTSEFRWRIKCEKPDLFSCYLESGHYHEGRQLYANSITKGYFLPRQEPREC